MTNKYNFRVYEYFEDIDYDFVDAVLILTTDDINEAIECARYCREQSSELYEYKIEVDF